MSATTVVPLAALDRLAKNVLEAVIEAYDPASSEGNAPQLLMESWLGFYLATDFDSAITVSSKFNQHFVETVRHGVRECLEKGRLTKRGAKRLAKVFKDLPYATETPELISEPVWQHFALIAR